MRAALRIGNDIISSVRVPRGWTVTLHEHAGFRGRTRRLTGDVNALGNFNDLTSSIEIAPPQPRGVRVYEHNGYGGAVQNLGPGRYDMGALRIGNDIISSVRVPRGWTVTLHEHAGFNGRTRRLTGDVNALGNFNDQTSSIEVRAGR